MKDVTQELFIMDKITWSTHRDENVEHAERINAKKDNSNNSSDTVENNDEETNY